jgi:DNA-binding MarR family transcriptional regulator
MTVHDEVTSRIGQAWKELRRGAASAIVREHLFGSGPDALEPGQVDTLDLLALEPKWRMSDLADALRVDPSTATRAVQRLERADLAIRQPSTGDGRVVMVSATKHGLERHRAIVAGRQTSMQAVLAGFTGAEREQLASLLERFVTAIDDFAAGLTAG